MAPRYSIIPGDFAEDPRADVGHFRVLNIIGRHTDHDGWCRIKQINIGEACGLTRETVNRKLRDLVSWGYVDKHAEDATGRAIWYRTLMDRARRPEPVAEADRDEPDLFDDPARETSGGPVRGGSHVGYNQDGAKTGELHTTCDPSLTPGVIAAITPGVTPAITHNDPLLTTKTSPLTPIGSADGGEVEFNDQDVRRNAILIEMLIEDCDHLEVVNRLLVPILRVRRFSAKDRVAALRELRDDARGIPSPALEKAAELVLSSGVDTIKAERIAEAIRMVKRAGAMVPIRRGTRQWAAWVEHLERTNPREAELMQRYDAWQVRAEWPPRSAERSAGGAQ